MSYVGETIVVSCSQGGLTGATNIDAIPSHMMVTPTRNLLLEKRGRRKRGGTTHLYSTAFSGAPRIMGLYDCIFRDLSQYLITATVAGDIYKNDTDTIATGLGTMLPYSFDMGEDKLFIADGVNELYVWTGAGNAAAVSEPAADWATAPPFQCMKRGRLLSERMCALNSTTIYFSAPYATAGDMELFITGAESIYIDTGDGHGLVGMCEWGSDIIVFGRRKAYRIDDSDATSSNWGFTPVQWSGGVANWRLIIKTPNDICCMADDGEIYSVQAVSDYGDYKQASLTKESWMHDWIKDNVDLAYVDHFHGKYHPTLRAIFIWVVRKGYTSADTALVFFLDRPVSEAWMIHDNQSYDSGYKASSAATVLKADGSYALYSGDYAGLVWKLDQSARNDNNNGFYAGFKTPNDAFNNPRATKHYNGLRIIMSPKGPYNLQIKIDVDGTTKATNTMDMGYSGVVLGTFVLDTDTLAAENLIDTESRLGYIGKRIQYEMYNSNKDEDFFISGYMTDYKNMGAARS